MKSALPIIAAVLCFVAAQWLAWGPLAEARTQMVGLRGDAAVVEPGEFAGTLMLGGFRGVACDLMWMRAQKAREAGRLYESVAMASSIVRIQPRFEQIWEFLAWDMAYNLASETEDPAGKWAWFQAGIEINVQGCRRNPDSNRLLRHLAWMFHHKGDELRERILTKRWDSWLNPLLAQVNQQLPASQRVALLPEQAGIGNFVISERLYTAALALADSSGARIPAATRGLRVHAIESDGNQFRNRGEHLLALRRYVVALEAWDQVIAWSHAQPIDGDDAEARRLHGEIAEHNQGRLRRKVQLMVHELATDRELATRTSEYIQSGRWQEATQAIAGSGWRTTLGGNKATWLDEPGR